MGGDDTKQDGGPAFPVMTGERQIAGHEKEFDALPGMTLRDWFAGQALGAIIAATSAGQHNPPMREGEVHLRYAIARDAYDMADAMLAVRAAAGGQR
jgi:hypothetical protein